MTRARERTYLITDMAAASAFVRELLGRKYPIETNEFDTSLWQKMADLLSCIRCRTGTQVPRTGRNGPFFGCSNYPLCTQVEGACPKCGGPMERNGRFKICLDSACDGWIPICSKCGAEMVKRNGRYGVFWGCRNYHGNEVPSCRNTVQDVSPRDQGCGDEAADWFAGNR